MRWVVALVLGILAAALQYGAGSPRRALAHWAPAGLRACAYTLLIALLLDAPGGPAPRIRPWVALDVSASMGRGDAALWHSALDSLRALNPDTVFQFGDSLRSGPPPARPADTRSDVEPVIQRALATGRPVVLITDGELAATAAADLRQLPTGSRVIVIPHASRPDVALASLDAPHSALTDDSLHVTLHLMAGVGGSAAGSVRLGVGSTVTTTIAIAAMGPWQRRDLALQLRTPAHEGRTLLRASVAAPGDVVAENDTISTPVDVTRQPGAVFVSTSPDYDARYALAVLRGALALPTRAFYLVSPGNWRTDDGFSKVTDADVRAAFRDAPLAVLQGDTAIFGPPERATSAPLALIVATPGDGQEWYASSAPTSPLSGALADVPWDSLPPLLVGPGAAPQGQWHGLDARRGRGLLTQALITGEEHPRRVVVAAGDLWRWEFRGGVSADVYTALWGSIFDYLVTPDSSKAGATPHAVASAFANSRDEWVPRPPVLTSTQLGDARSVTGAAPSSRDTRWVYLLLMAALSAEWILRRRAGMR